MSAATKYNLEARVVANYQELLNDPTIDAVSICTPPYMHATIAIDFLKAGKHVLVEKPMASSLKECDEMIKASIESQKLLSVVAQNRFMTPIMRLKHVLDQNLIGKIAHTQVDSFGGVVIVIMIYGGAVHGKKKVEVVHLIMLSIILICCNGC